mgnify:CR=1 FL=1
MLWIVGHHRRRRARSAWRAGRCPRPQGSFCCRGGRFGTHSSNESMTPIYYKRVLFFAHFNAGVRARRHPRSLPSARDRAITSRPVTGEHRTAVRQGRAASERCKTAIQTNNVEVDDRGYIYAVDRANTGLHPRLDGRGAFDRKLFRAGTLRPAASRASRSTIDDSTSALTSDTASQSIPDPVACATLNPRTVRNGDGGARADCGRTNSRSCGRARDRRASRPDAGRGSRFVLRSTQTRPARSRAPAVNSRVAPKARAFPYADPDDATLDRLIARVARTCVVTASVARSSFARQSRHRGAERTTRSAVAAHPASAPPLSQCQRWSIERDRAGARGRIASSVASARRAMRAARNSGAPRRDPRATRAARRASRRNSGTCANAF